ncbi:hypothetical protein KDN24_06185 [Bacillus sp. Bva_UNVM-123]|uniref:hypothetical protein n=1 Tax=Bacillus sp. Bva_UNVM-123 TaxID=2829798 RepID=UPI00391FB21E
MNYIDRYIHRLKSKGDNMSTSLINRSKRKTNDQFHTSPSYSIVKVNGIETDSIVNNTKEYTEKQIFFKPDVIKDIGSIVEYKEKTYLLMRFIENEIYPTATLRLCNSTFPIETNKTPVLMRDEDGNPKKDKYNRPILSPSSGLPINKPCIVETKYYFNNRNEQVTLPEDRIMVTLKYQEAPNIEINEEFEMYKSRFRITFIDYSKVVNTVGVMTLTGERVMNK